MERIGQARFSCKADTSLLYYTSPVGIVADTDTRSEKIVTHKQNIKSGNEITAKRMNIKKY